MRIMVPDSMVDQGGEMIRDLQKRTGCHVNIVRDIGSTNGLRPIDLIGSIEAAQKAKGLIMDIVLRKQ